MDLLRIAARVAAERTTAGPTLDIFKDLSGGTVENAVTQEISRRDEDEAMEVMISAVHDVYGQSVADEVRDGASNTGPTGVVHELLHKVAEPEFALALGAGLSEQTSKSIVESSIDEMLISYVERGGVQDFDNIFTAIIDSFDTVDQFLTELEKGAEHSALDRAMKGSAAHVRRSRPDLPGKGLDKVPWPTQSDPNRQTSAVSAAMWVAQKYLMEKIPQLADTMIAQPAEAQFKKFVNLALSRLRKLPLVMP
jgi:hypothetical protein